MKDYYQREQAALVAEREGRYDDASLIWHDAALSTASERLRRRAFAAALDNLTLAKRDALRRNSA